MGFMDFMHTYCKLGKHFDWLPSSYISIYVLGSKNWDVVIQNFNKTQFWPNFMGFMGTYSKLGKYFNWCQQQC